MSDALKRRIEKLLKQIAEAGPFHPGRISKQYNVCGKPGCRCKDVEDPRKHGPYHYLSYTFGGKGKTVFVPKEHLTEMQRRTRAYARLKQLLSALTEANIQLAAKEVLGKNGGSGRQKVGRKSTGQRKGGKQ